MSNQAWGDVDTDTARALMGPVNINATIPSTELQTILQLEPEAIALSRDVIETAGNSKTVTHNPSFAGGGLSGYPTGGGFVESTSKGNTTSVGSIQDQRTSFVREEYAAIMMRDVTGADSTPSAVGVTFSSGI